MTLAPERRQLIGWIEEAVAAGARKAPACAEVGISLRTLQRWTSEGAPQEDRRPVAQRPAPQNKLAEEERQTILDMCNRPEFASEPPGQIVPILADRGEYIASESSFYRTLFEAGPCRQIPEGRFLHHFSSFSCCTVSSCQPIRIAAAHTTILTQGAT